MGKIAGQVTDASRLRSDGAASSGGDGGAGVLTCYRSAIAKCFAGKDHQLAALAGPGEVQERHGGPSRRSRPEPITQPAPVNVRPHEENVRRTGRSLIQGQHINRLRIARKLADNPRECGNTGPGEAQQIGASRSFQHEPARARITLRYWMLPRSEERR